MSSRKFPQEVWDEAAAFREKGWSAQRIARRIGCSAAAVSWNMLKLGADPEHLSRRILPPTRPGPPVHKRSGVAVRAFCPTEDVLIRRLASEGLCSSAIGRQLDPPRRPNSITGRLMTLARHDARREAAKEADERLQ